MFAAPSTIAASTTWPLPSSRGKDSERKVERTTADVAKQGQRRFRPLAGWVASAPERAVKVLS